MKKSAVFMHQTNGSFTYCHKMTGFLKIFYLVQFMLIHVNENFFVGLLIQLNLINLSKACLFQVEDNPK